MIRSLWFGTLRLGASFLPFPSLNRLSYLKIPLPPIDCLLTPPPTPTRQCIYRLSGHTSTIRCIRVLDNRPLAVSGSRDGTVRVWDIQRGRCVRVLRGHEQSVRTLDCEGNRVVSGSYDATVRVSVFFSVQGAVLFCSRRCFTWGQGVDCVD